MDNEPERRLVDLFSAGCERQHNGPCSTCSHVAQNKSQRAIVFDAQTFSLQEETTPLVTHLLII